MEKRRAFVGLVVVAVLTCGSVFARVVEDKILARVNGRNILLSDTKEPRIEKTIEGGKTGTYSLEEAINNEVLFQKAMERKLAPSAMDVEKNISAWKEAHNLAKLGDKEVNERLKAEGLTLSRYRKQLAGVIAIRNLKEVETSERIVVTSREVEEYHAANPEDQAERYKLQTKIVPFRIASGEADAVAKEKDIPWIDVDWIERPKLIPTMSAVVTEMKEGGVSKPLKVDQGYQFIKLVSKEEKRPKTLGERWGEIERTLQKEKMETFEKGYIEGLCERASIVYL